MPTSGTHITIMQRLALNPLLSPLLGNPDTDPAVTDPNSPKYDPDGYIRMKFACLGAVGPDVFYAMADYGADEQDYENFLIKVGGSFECMSEIMEETTRYIKGELATITQDVVTSLLQTSTLLTGVINDSLLAFIVKAGFNFWPNFASMRQKDRPLHEWYWADFLHYVRSGKFVHELLTQTKQRLDGDPHNTQYQNLYAYALGYLTHYIADVVGHPYVNQVVQAPWRLYWQRHHLVENFIDAYVWDRWHAQLPPFPPPDPREQPLDRVTSIANTMGAGAPFTFARLHDFIAIGTPALDGPVGDPIDALVEAVCEKIKQGLFDLGIAEKTDVPEPADADFKAWTCLMAEALQSVYADPLPHPTNLADPGLGLLGGPRKDGYPEAGDIAAAYGTMRLLLKLTTEETITEPQPPDIVGDISADVTKLLTDLQTNLSNLPQPPQPSLSGNTLNLDDLWKAIKNTARWLAEVAEQVVKTVCDFISESIALGDTTVTDSIKFALYLLNKALFALYRSVRLVIVLAADAAPFTQDLELNVGDSFNTRSLWCSPGDLGLDQYPLEEYTLNIGGMRIAPQLEFAHNPLAPYPPYAPFISPTALGAGVERPPVNLTAPYMPAPGATFTTPDAFIDAPRGPDDMFTPGGPQPKDPLAPNTFAAEPRNFGGAMANCEWALLHWSGQGFVLPDYNLDGDRGYAWPCWDLETPVAEKAPKKPAGPPDPADPAWAAYIDAVPDPLDPTDDSAGRNVGGIAHLNTQLIN